MGIPAVTSTYEKCLNDFHLNNIELPASRKSISICGDLSREERKGLVAYCLSKKWYEEAKILVGNANSLDAKELRVMVFDRILNGQPEKKWRSREGAALKYAVSNIPFNQFEWIRGFIPLDRVDQVRNKFLTARRTTITI